MKEIIKKIGKSLLMVIVASIIGIVALVAVYNIPVSTISKHITESEKELRSQRDDDSDYENNASTIFDTRTNIIMLHEAMYPLSGSSINDALINPAAEYYVGTTDEWIDRLCYLSKTGDFDRYEKTPYPRYWHGYLTYLKPLLSLFDLSEIYRLNFIVVVASIIAVWYLALKKLGKYSYAYLIMLSTMNVGNIYQSFQLSTAFYAMQLTLILLLLQNKEDIEKNAWWIFLLDGIVLAYIDFLTYPILAFSIPIAVYLLLTKEKKIKALCVEFIKNGVFFTIGYAGMWLMKWVYATLLTDVNVIEDAIQSVYHRVGGENMQTQDFIVPTRKIAFSWNLTTYFSFVNIVIIISLIIAFIILIIVKRKLCFHKDVALISFFGILMPIAWIFFVYNHCAQHPHLEWRSFCGILFSISLFAISLIEYKNDKYMVE